jgi:hypothetical protein
MFHHFIARLPCTVSTGMSAISAAGGRTVIPDGMGMMTRPSARRCQSGG